MDIPRKHARLGPSSLHRRLACSGSYFLEADPYLAPYSTPYAEEGSSAHDALETNEPADEETESAIDYFRQTIELYTGGEQYDPTVHYDVMVQGTEEYLEHPSIADFAGTPDHYLIAFDPFTGRPVVHVFDYKHGKGVLVKAAGNKQLLAYAILVLSTHAQLLFDWGIEFKEIDFHLTIVQPRAYQATTPVDHYRTTYTELKSLEHVLAKHRERLQDIEQRITEEPSAIEAYLTPGQHCQFCDAMSICPEIKRRLERPVPKEIPPERVLHYAELFAALKAISDLPNQLEFQMLNCIEQHGVSFPGLKVVKALGNTTWIDKDRERLKRRLKRMGLRESHITKKVLLTVNQIQQLITKDETLRAKVSLEAIDELAHRPDKGFKLVPESSRGQAVDLRPVATLFKEMIDGEKDQR